MRVLNTFKSINVEDIFYLLLKDESPFYFLKEKEALRKNIGPERFEIRVIRNQLRISHHN